MSYKSEIVIAIQKEEYVKATLRKDFPTPLLEEGYKEGETLDCEPNGILYWHIEGWEWYERVSAIKEITDFFNYLDALEEKENIEELYGFIRIGENDDDIEIRGWPYHLGLDYQRFVSTPMHQI